MQTVTTQLLGTAVAIGSSALRRHHIWEEVQQGQGGSMHGKAGPAIAICSHFSSSAIRVLAQNSGGGLPASGSAQPLPPPAHTCHHSTTCSAATCLHSGAW